MSHSTQNTSLRRRFPKPVSWLGMEKKLNLTHQKHTFTNQKKCTTAWNQHKKTKAFYDTWPGNGIDLLSKVYCHTVSCDQDTSPTCSLTDVRQHLKDDQVMYCLLRLTTTFDMSTTVKFIYIHWSVFTCSVHEPSTAENLLGNILLSLSVVYNLP